MLGTTAVNDKFLFNNNVKEDWFIETLFRRSAKNFIFIQQEGIWYCRSESKDAHTLPPKVVPLLSL